jgi:hypothetical protein
MTKRPMDPIAELKPTPPIEDADVVDQPGPPSYEEEIEAERRGTTADRVDEDDALDDDSEPDAAYRPGTG